MDGIGSPSLAPCPTSLPCQCIARPERARGTRRTCFTAASSRITSARRSRSSFVVCFCFRRSCGGVPPFRSSVQPGRGGPARPYLLQAADRRLQRRLRLRRLRLEVLHLQGRLSVPLVQVLHLADQQRALGAPLGRLPGAVHLQRRRLPPRHSSSARTAVPSPLTFCCHRATASLAAFRSPSVCRQAACAAFTATLRSSTWACSTRCAFVAASHSARTRARLASSRDTSPRLVSSAARASCSCCAARPT